MRTDVKCCILCYINNDKKTYNPCLILTDPDVETEICNITSKMMDEGIDVRIWTHSPVDSVKDLPPLTQPVGDGIEDYTYILG